MNIAINKYIYIYINIKSILGIIKICICFMCFKLFLFFFKCGTSVNVCSHLPAVHGQNGRLLGRNFSDCRSNMVVSQVTGGYPKIILFNGIFHYKAFGGNCSNPPYPMPYPHLIPSSCPSHSAKAEPLGQIASNPWRPEVPG